MRNGSLQQVERGDDVKTLQQSLRLEASSNRMAHKPMVLMARSTMRAAAECSEQVSEGSPSGHPFDLYDNRKDREDACQRGVTLIPESSGDRTALRSQPAGHSCYH